MQHFPGRPLRFPSDEFQFSSLSGLLCGSGSVIPSVLVIEARVLRLWPRFRADAIPAYESILICGLDVFWRAGGAPSWVFRWSCRRNAVDSRLSGCFENHIFVIYSVSTGLCSMRSVPEDVSKRHINSLNERTEKTASGFSALFGISSFRHLITCAMQILFFNHSCSLTEKMFNFAGMVERGLWCVWWDENKEFIEIKY